VTEAVAPTRAAPPSAAIRPLRELLAPGWLLPPLALLAVLYFYPLALILAQSLQGPSLGAYAQVLGTAMFRNAALNTVEIALSATACCLVLGFGLALVLAFVPFPGAHTIARGTDVFISLPTFLVALALTFLYGSAGMVNEALMRVSGASLPPLDFLYSQAGVVLAETTVYTPFVLRPLLAAFSLIDPAQIEVASSLGARAPRIVRQVILPAAMPALLAGGSLCLLLTVNEFGIVFFIGAKGVITLPLLIYDKAIQEFDYTTACVAAVVNVGLSVLLYALTRVLVSGVGSWRAGLV
jgi:2-aminoethylphosphonate transport system permease protein